MKSRRAKIILIYLEVILAVPENMADINSMNVSYLVFSFSFK